MLHIIRERLTLILIGLLPLHALLVTVLTKLIVGPGHSPLPILALWKEALLGGILFLAITEWGTKFIMQNAKCKIGHEECKMQNAQCKIDVLDVCIALLIGWLIVQPIIFHFPFSIFNFVLGFKYDFLPLIAFVILRRVPWSSWFMSTAVAVLLWVGGIVSAYGIVTEFLPMSFFTWLGYSDLHSLYLPDAPLAAFQQIGGTTIRRIQSTMSGPNQLGIWLLIPWSVCIIHALRERTFLRFFVSSCIGLAILLTFSRAAWIAATVMSIIVGWQYVSKDKRIVSGFGLLVAGIMIVVSAMTIAPDIVLRAASSRGHWERPLQALRLMQEHPFGMGLGSAGPASNRMSDACIELAAGSDASWAEDRPDLCVFVGGKQVQPIDRLCHCPVLPENWYLQIGVELGWIGFLIYVGLILLILRKGFVCSFFRFFVSSNTPKRESEQTSKRVNEQTGLEVLSYAVPLAFLGVSVAALFLHAWEDSAMSWTVWGMMAIVLNGENK